MESAEIKRLVLLGKPEFGLDDVSAELSSPGLDRLIQLLGEIAVGVCPAISLVPAPTGPIVLFVEEPEGRWEAKLRSPHARALGLTRSDLAPALERCSEIAALRTPLRAVEIPVRLGQGDSERPTTLVLSAPAARRPSRPTLRMRRGSHGFPSSTPNGETSLSS